MEELHTYRINHVNQGKLTINHKEEKVCIWQN